MTESSSGSVVLLNLIDLTVIMRDTHWKAGYPRSLPDRQVAGKRRAQLTGEASEPSASDVAFQVAQLQSPAG
jgi:hypothetical protein